MTPYFLSFDQVVIKGRAEQHNILGRNNINGALGLLRDGDVHKFCAVKELQPKNWASGPFELVLFDLVMERISMDSEEFGRLGNIPSSRFQGPQNVVAFDLFQSARST